MVTLEEYLKLDDQNQRPSEYANGIMVPIEAASKEHGAIAANLMYLIGALDPLLIIEVLSPTTEDYKRGTKFKHYRSMPRFSDYILVAQDKVSIEHWKLVPEIGKWTLHASLTDKSESLEVIGDLLRLSDIYWDVEPVAYL